MHAWDYISLMHAKNTFGMVDFSAHARSKLHGQKRQFEKVTQKKKKVLNNPKHNVGRHFNFSKQCRPLL
jgi:hypothetical protein